MSMKKPLGPGSLSLLQEQSDSFIPKSSSFGLDSLVSLLKLKWNTLAAYSALCWS